MGTGSPMNVTLGPGILDHLLEGIERPLKAIEEESGAFISRGSSVPSLDTQRQWEVTVTVKPGDRLNSGDIYAECPETPIIRHKCMVPPNVSGVVQKAAPDGK